MAISHGSSVSKTEVYESLYLICQATQQITDHLDRLRAANVLGRTSAEINKTAALQLRAEITTSAVHNLAGPEIAEAHRHESKRIRMEKKAQQAKPRTTLRRKSSIQRTSLWLLAQPAWDQPQNGSLTNSSQPR